MLVSGCDCMNLEEKSPVSFVLSMISMLIAYKHDQELQPCFHRRDGWKCPKERQCGKAEEVRHARRQGCQYGATTNLDD